MNFLLLWPAGLAALAALAIPLLLHLARRSERRPTDFAALAWLHAHARPRRHVRFDEWLLLAIRLLLVAVLALLLARPAHVGRGDDAGWVVADPALPATVLQATGPPGAHRAWLAPGFPDATEPPPAAPVPAVSLLRELDAALPPGARLTVLVPPILAGADAEIPRLSRRIDWRVVKGATPRPTPARPTDALPTLVLRHPDDRAAAARYLTAAATAWHAATPGERPATEAAAAVDAGAPDKGIPENARLLAWLVPGPLPPHVAAWIDRGGTALVASDTVVPALANAPARWRADDGTVLMRGGALGAGRLLQWTTALDPAHMPILLEPRFAGELGALLAPGAHAPDRVDARAHAPASGAPTWPLSPTEIAPWLVLLAALLFLLERWLATRRARATRS